MEVDLEISDVQLDYGQHDAESMDHALLQDTGLPKTSKENLKISIDNEPDPDPAVTFLKLEEAEDEETEDGGRNSPLIQVKLSSEHTKNSKYQAYQDKQKLYENKTSDSQSGDARSKQRESVRRLNVGVKPACVQVESTEELYESLGVSEADLRLTGERQLRCNAITLSGVEDLHTEDIFTYFCKYPPKNLEWIDDSSCNVVFANVNDANRALINMSDPIRSLSSAVSRHKKSAKSRLGGGNADDNEPDQSAKDSLAVISDDMDDSIDLLTEIDERVDVSDPAVTTTSALASEQKTLHMDVEKGKTTSNDESTGVYMDERQVPPGIWRVGIPCEKARGELFMRLATEADVKEKGAERRSHFYRKHGNPNYGGLPGLISRSKKGRFRQNQEKILEEEAREVVSEGRTKVTYDENDLFGETYEETDVNSTAERVSYRLPEGDSEMTSILGSRKRGLNTSDEDDLSEQIDEFMDHTGINRKRQKPMMKMAADEEEEKLNAIRAQSQALLEAVDVRNRLKRKKLGRHSQTEHLVKQEPARPDLRSRLSRRNDW